MLHLEETCVRHPQQLALLMRVHGVFLECSTLRFYTLIASAIQVTYDYLGQHIMKLQLVKLLLQQPEIPLPVYCLGVAVELH